MVELLLELVLFSTGVYFFMSYMQYPRLTIEGDKCCIVRGFNSYLNIRLYLLYGVYEWTDVPSFVSILDGERVFKELRGIQ